MYGRLGCARCEQCRKWRQKVVVIKKSYVDDECEYQMPDSHCKVCMEKGLPCGPKVYGPERRRRSGNNPRSGQTITTVAKPLPQSDDQKLSQLDYQYLQFWDFQNSFPFFILHRNQRTQSIFSCKVFRYAFLTFVSNWDKMGNRDSKHDALVYLDKFFVLSRKNFTLQVTVERAYASLFLIQHQFYRAEQKEALFLHLFGFVAMLNELRHTHCSTRIGHHLWVLKSLAIGLYHCSQPFYLIFGTPNSPNEGPLWKWHTLITSSSRLLNDDITVEMDETQATLWTAYKVVFLTRSFHFHLFHYVIRKVSKQALDSQQTEEIFRALMWTINQLIRYIPKLTGLVEGLPADDIILRAHCNISFPADRIPTVPDRERARHEGTYLEFARTFYSTTIIKYVLLEDAQSDVAISSAYALYSIYTECSSYSYPERYGWHLFWAAVILSESSNPICRASRTGNANVIRSRIDYNSTECMGIKPAIPTKIHTNAAREVKDHGRYWSSRNTFQFLQCRQWHR